MSSYYKLVQCWDQCRCGDRADGDHANINRHWAGFYAATPATMPLCQAATVPFDLVFRPPLSVNGSPDCQGINKSFTALGLGSFQCLMTLFLYLWAAPFSAWRYIKYFGGLGQQQLIWFWTAWPKMSIYEFSYFWNIGLMRTELKEKPLEKVWLTLPAFMRFRNFLFR